MAISYAKALNAPMLELEQERSLIRRWQNRQDRSALEELILSHVRQVYSLVMRTSYDLSDREELVAEGVVGLIMAAERFDLAREVRFSTYAQWWVRNRVSAARASMSSVVDLPSRVKRGLNGSLSSQSIEYAKDENSEDWSERLESDDPTPEEQVIANSTHQSLRQVIGEVMNELEEMEREILVSRNLNQVPATIEDLAQRLGMSRDRLRQVERRAMARMKFGLMSRGVTAAQLG